MAIAIHIAFRDRINNKDEALKYVSVVVASLLWMGLIAMYLYMGYTVSRLTKSLQTYALLDVKDLKNEPCRFWLEDKTAHGNLFQRHFNLICMLRDIFICVCLLALYNSTTTMLVLLLIMQVAFCVLAITYPPYRINWHNRVMQVTHCLYVFLDIAFLVNINAKMSATTRYNWVGFSMVFIVVGIILTNVLVSAYQTVAETVRKCKKKKTDNKSKVIPVEQSPSVMNEQEASQELFNKPASDAKTIVGVDSEKSGSQTNTRKVEKQVLRPPLKIMKRRRVLKDIAKV